MANLLRPVTSAVAGTATAWGGEDSNNVITYLNSISPCSAVVIKSGSNTIETRANTIGTQTTSTNAYDIIQGAIDNLA